jgi:hypothetical protein
VGLQGIVALLITLTASPRRPGDLLPALVIALVLIAPWPVRNYLAAGNPLMPMPLPGIERGLAAPAWQAMQVEAHRVNWTLGALPGIAASPWTMGFGRWDDLESGWGAAAFVGPWLWLGAPLLLLWRRRVLVPRSVWFYGLGAMAVALGSFRLTRLAYPGLGAMLVVAGAGLELARYECGRRPWSKMIFTFIVATLGLLLLSLLMIQSSKLSGGYGFPRVHGDLEAYLRGRAKLAPGEMGPLVLEAAAKGALPEDAVVLLVGETRFLYLEHGAVAPSALTRNPLVESLRGRTEAETAGELRKAGVTHVLIDFPGLERMARAAPYLEISPELIARVRAFSRGPCRAVLTGEQADTVICRLTD